jgi:CCR4-NOT transcription complex subunit 6
VLADVCATLEKFPDYPLSALGWEHRRQNLLKEISQLDANIICLQEVQHNHFKQIFRPELTKQGYVVLFKEKKRERYTPTVDGCAIFYRMNQFDFLKCERINFRYFAKDFPPF